MTVRVESMSEEQRLTFVEEAIKSLGRKHSYEPLTEREARVEGCKVLRKSFIGNYATSATRPEADAIDIASRIGLVNGVEEAKKFYDIANDLRVPLTTGWFGLPAGLSFEKSIDGQGRKSYKVSFYKEDFAW